MTKYDPCDPHRIHRRSWGRGLQQHGYRRRPGCLCTGTHTALPRLHWEKSQGHFCHQGVGFLQWPLGGQLPVLLGEHSHWGSWGGAPTPLEETAPDLVNREQYESMGGAGHRITHVAPKCRQTHRTISRKVTLEIVHAAQQFHWYTFILICIFLLFAPEVLSK